MANMLLIGHAMHIEKLRSKGKDYKSLKMHPEDSFAFWLDHGHLRVEAVDETKEELPCLFAGTGFSESDGMKEGGNE